MALLLKAKLWTISHWMPRKKVDITHGNVFPFHFWFIFIMYKVQHSQDEYVLNGNYVLNYSIILMVKTNKRLMTAAIWSANYTLSPSFYTLNGIFNLFLNNAPQVMNPTPKLSYFSLWKCYCSILYGKKSFLLLLIAPQVIEVPDLSRTLRRSQNHHTPTLSHLKWRWLISQS